MDTPTLLGHLQTRARPLTLPRGGTLCWDDAALHHTAYTHDPQGYALLGLAPGVTPWQRARVLLQILAASQAGLGEPARDTLARTARVLTLALPPGHVITVLLGLRRLRANHKHTTRTALRFVLEHPDADALIAARRPAMADCFEHALGKATARGCARRIADGDTGSDYLRRRLLRFLTAPAAALPRVQALYATEPRGPARPAGPGRPALAFDTAGRRPRTAFPRFEGTLALVLDAPAPGPGHDRQRRTVPPQAAALRAVLAEVCARLEVVEIDGRPPNGATGPAADLATGVLEAMGTGPDLVAVVSGDPARAAATLPRAGVTTPVVLCHAPAAAGDGRQAPRRPDPHGPWRGFRHPDDFDELLPWMFGHCAAGVPWLRDALRDRLDVLDRRAALLNA